MWRNPDRPQPEPSKPPDPSGRLISASERSGRGMGPDTELRVTLDEFKGNPYLSLRVWTKAQNGNWFPTQKGVSVRLGEAEDVAGALIEGVRIATAPSAKLPPKTPGTGSQRQTRELAPTRPSKTRPNHSASATPSAGQFDPDFDEFE